MKNDPLNQILQNWAERHAAETRNTANLESRIRERLRQEPARLRAQPACMRERLRRTKAVWFLAGAGALLMLQLALTVLQRPRTEPDDSLALLQREISKTSTTASLFNEVMTLFPQRLRWIAETEETIHVEVGGPPRHSGTEATHLEMRLVALRRAGDAFWEHAWTVTVITDGTDLISIDIPEQGHLDLWAQQVDEQLIAVDTRIDLQQGKASVSRALTPGAPDRCLYAQTPTGEFRVYQIISPVPEHPLHPQT